MDNVSKELLTRIKGQFQTKYGIEMDDWSAMVLHEIHQNSQTMNQQINLSIDSIEKASKRINGQIRPIHFENKQAAFSYGIGITLPLAIMGCFVAILIFWYANSTQEFKENQQFLEEYKAAATYKLLMQKGKVIELNGQNNLVLKLAEKGGNISIGKDFIYDKSKKQVLVPLGKK